MQRKSIVAINTIVGTVVAFVVSSVFFSGDQVPWLQAITVGGGVGLGTWLGQRLRGTTR